MHEAENPIGGCNSRVSASSPLQLNGTVPDSELTPSRVLPSYPSMVDPNKGNIPITRGTLECTWGFQLNSSPKGKNRRVDVTDGETKEFAEYIQQSNLQEFSYEGAFFTETNKTIWSKIDRVVHNGLWYEAFAYTHVHIMAQGLSDHTPVILSFPPLPKPKSTFIFYDMWTKDQGFKDIIKHRLA
ncbi:hypothetical protein Cgig2_017670 [Carnegiea gigantea]|uniref:Uncharacterized protein n=1 Tax=Carnegiea gigantea TaxID=171969 RepID=A0A9Q1GHY1_9CARY|nr:hypothetical protein Cgig2_017670 [Carnegiea gigantea]